MEGERMPVWHDPPEEELHGALQSVWEELNKEVNTAPPFESVTGIPMDQLTEHAMKAITAFLSSDEVDPQNPITWVRLYCMAFVVGMKYGESRVSNNTQEIA
jgi:hypothetical protein